MPLQFDPSVNFEHTLAIVRKEGEMPRPEDTRCRAKVGNGRCKNDITFDQDGDYWSKLCDEHHTEDQEARTSGEPRVERV